MVVILQRIWHPPKGKRGNVTLMDKITLNNKRGGCWPPIDRPTRGAATPIDLEMTRLIPTAVKLEVWRRDGGRCVTCGATDNLHFDHIIPYSKGGTSLHADNIQLLCARHNLEKRDRIM